MKIDLTCAACGGNNFELGDMESDDRSIECADCGHVIGTMGELKAKLANEVMRSSRKPKRRSAVST